MRGPCTSKMRTLDAKSHYVVSWPGRKLVVVQIFVDSWTEPERRRGIIGEHIGNGFRWSC